LSKSGSAFATLAAGDDMAGVWAARRGTDRVLLYRIKDDLREVVVLRIDHRRDAYRPLGSAQPDFGEEPGDRERGQSQA
jgi:hypothetical protein